MDRHRKNSLFATLALFLSFLITGPPALAQVDDARGPDIGIGPDGGSYTIAATTLQEAHQAGGQKVELSIKFTDPDGLNRYTMGVFRIYNGSTEPVTNVTWWANEGATFATAKATITLFDAGEHVIRATIADQTGATGSAQVTFRVTYTDPALPIVSTEPHHDDYRNTTIGAAVLGYSMPSYTSLGIERSAGIRYDSEQADPTGFAQFDVRPHVSRLTEFAGGSYSLRMFDALTNVPVTAETMWPITTSGLPQRLAAQWSMRDRPTGAYQYLAEVRAYRSNGTYTVKRVPVRVLVVNHAGSRYGSGWSLAGIPRIYATSAGLLLEEGNGIARWFAREACPGSCAYRTPAGDFSSIVYNAAANQWVRTFGDGTTHTFAGQGLLIAVADRFGRTTTMQWQLSADGHNQMILSRITDPAGKVTVFDYHYGNYLKSITDPAGRLAWFYYTHTDLTQIGGVRTLTSTYDANRRVTSFTDVRGTWDVTYDAFGKLKSWTAPAITASGGSMRPVTQFASLQSLVIPVSAPAVAIRSDQAFAATTDAGGHTTKVLADRYGNALKVIDPLGEIVQSFWSEHGLPRSIGTLGGPSAIYSWNARGQLLTKEVGGSVVYHASYIGDQLDYENVAGDARWYQYGDRGQILKSWYGRKEDATRNATTYNYDDALRLIRTVGPKGETTEWSYDPVWQNVSEVRRLAQDGAWRRTSVAYDTAGRPGTVTNPLGETTTSSYDALNRPVRVVQSPQRVTEYTYTGAYLTSVTVPGPRTYGFAYNALGWLMKETFPDMKSRSYAYDIEGLLISHTDRRVQTAELAYDARHRMTSRLADGIRTTFTYPSTYTVVAKNNEVEETLNYHSETGGLVSTSYALGSAKYVLEKVLDGNAGWTQLGLNVRHYSSGNLQRTDTIRYHTDFAPANAALSRAFQIDDFSGAATILGYDASGRHVSTSFPNGVVQQNHFNNEGQTVSATYSGLPSLNGVYEYDPLGRLSRRTSWGGDFGRFYYYDDYGQLRHYQKAEYKPAFGCNPSFENCDYLWVPTLQETYNYDLAGNRTDRGATLEPGTNRYRTFNGYTFEYDAEGNLSRKSKAGFEQRLTWNTLGQLASVTTNGTTVTYGYTPSGARFRRTLAGVTNYYVYEGGDLLLEADSAGNPLRRYTHLPGTDRPLSVRETIAGGDRTYYFTSEPPGHVASLMTTAGGIAAGYDYGPFGTETSFNDGQPLRFMGRELDHHTGLYYVRARWYDPAMARFISEDPIGLAGGMNTYAYVDNDPVNRRDPSGLGPECPNCLPTVVVECKQSYDPRCDDPSPWNAYNPDEILVPLTGGRPSRDYVLEGFGSLWTNVLKPALSGFHIPPDRSYERNVVPKVMLEEYAGVCGQESLNTYTRQVMRGVAGATIIGGGDAAKDVIHSGRKNLVSFRTVGSLGRRTVAGAAVGFVLGGGHNGALGWSACMTPVNNHVY